MVGFGAQLGSSEKEEWRQFYVNYDLLKRLIKDCRQAQQAAAEQPGLARLLEARKAIFQGQLDAEVLKVIEFYKKHSHELLESVETETADVQAALQPQQQQLLPHSADKAAALDSHAAVLQELIRQTTQLLQFVSLNMTAIRKILKKYSKNVNQHTNEPMAGFMTLEVEHPTDPGWKVLQGTFLPSEVADDLHDMQQHRELLEAMGKLQQLFEEARNYRRRLVARASMEIPSQGDERLGVIAGYVEEMQHAEEEAVRHAALVHAVPWVERAAGMFEPPPPDRYAVATLAGLVLNNLSSLLFMANYTAVLPPTDALCVRIGVPSSFTGFIMAASDLAAIFTSVGISFWTQHSFKQPLLFSAVSCFAGNIMFVLSYKWRSLSVLLAARLLNGLGSARTANRRYTADYVSKSKRTMASAAFVGCSNLGMALGPLLSLPLAYLPDTHVAGLPVNPITAVGWIMALAWLIFFVCSAIWFPELPKRMPIGLARASMLLPGEGGTTGTAGTASSTPGRGFLSANTGGDSLRLPLLATVYSEEEVAADVEHLGADLAPAAAPLPPRAQHAQQEDGGLPHGDKLAEQSAAAAWRATIPGTVACTLCLFVQKMVQQSYMDSLPLFTPMLYRWSSSQIGLYLGLVSLAMVPVNVAVGAVSAHLSDRSMVFGSLLLCTACLLALTAATASSVAFFGGGVLLFVGTVVLEGTATSLMSKCIWRGFAQGVLNAGLLSTEAGTIGRFAGNAMLALVGRVTGLDNLAELARFAHLLHLGLAAVCAGLLVHLSCNFARLRG